MSNSAYLTDAIDQIGKVTTAPELAELAGLIDAALGKQVAAIGAEAAKLAPLVALATVSFSTLPQVVTFLTQLQTALCGPAVAADAKMVAQLAEITAGAALVAAAVAEAEARINGS